MFDKCLYFNVIKLSRTIGSLWESAYRPLGLSPSHAYLMQLILDSPGDTPKSLAKKMDLKLSTISRLVDGLSSNKLVERKKENQDKRECSVHPTRNGLRLEKDLNQITESLKKRMEKVLGVSNVKSAVSIIDELNKTIISDVGGKK